MSRDDDADGRRDDPQEIDLDWSDREDQEEDIVECPRCGRAVYWSASLCPACGTWLQGGDSQAARRSRGWVWPLMVAILIAVILVMWHGL